MFGRRKDDEIIAVTNKQEQDEIFYNWFDPAKRQETRATFGLPDDGKVWCVSCQKSHLPPECSN